MIDHLDGSQEPALPAPTAGIDWASSEHAVAVVDTHGAQLDRFTVAHTVPGLRSLVARLRRAGVDEIAIERPDGPVVDALLKAGFGVVVIAPNHAAEWVIGSADERAYWYMFQVQLNCDRCISPGWPPRCCVADALEVVGILAGHERCCSPGRRRVRPGLELASVRSGDCGRRDRSGHLDDAVRGDPVPARRAPNPSPTPGGATPNHLYPCTLLLIGIAMAITAAMLDSAWVLVAYLCLWVLTGVLALLLFLVLLKRLRRRYPEEG